MCKIQRIRDAADITLEADKTGRIAWVICKLKTMQLFTHATSHRFRAVYYKNNKNKGVIFCNKINPKIF